MLPPVIAAVRGGAAARHRHRPVGRRQVPLRLLLGDRRAAAVRRVRPVQPERDRLGRMGGIVAPGRAPRPARRCAAGRRWSRSAATAGGSTSPTRCTAPGTTSSTRGRRRAGWPSSTPTRTAGSPWTSGSSESTSAGARPPGPPPGRRRLLRLLLLPVTARPARRAAGRPSWPRSRSAFHGLNPAMGWLFAVALGLQATPPRGRRVAARRRCPIAAGHLVSVVAIAAIFAITGSAVTSRAVPVGGRRRTGRDGPVAAVSQRHYRGRNADDPMGARDLVVPDVVDARSRADARAGARAPTTASRSRLAGLAAAATPAYRDDGAHGRERGPFAVLELGLGVLRKAWVNVDQVWAVAIGAGAATALTH